MEFEHPAKLAARYASWNKVRRLSFIDNLKANPTLQKATNDFHEKVNKMDSSNGLDRKLNWEWYCPSEESIPVAFCLDTSLHGLRYVGQRKRHICERLFWLISFSISVTVAAVLIWGMWKTYKSSPLVTVLNPSEKTLDVIPFPAITICNVNSLQKSLMDLHVQTVIQNLQEDGIITDTSEEFRRSLGQFLDMEYLCDSSLSFMDQFITNTTFSKWFKDHQIEIVKESDEFLEHLDPATTLYNFSQPCEKLILHCVWQDDVKNCSELFTPIETDYGYCCTFNTMPVSLLLRYSESSRDSPEVVKGWENDDLDYEKLMFTEETIDRKYPARQTYPGKSAGLSILINPDLDEYFCPHTDSEGFIMGISVPIDFPRMKETGIAIKTNSEIFVNVRPEIMLSDESMKDFPLEKRGCYYRSDYELPHYTMYTANNCMGECIARKMLDLCGCVRYHLPHGKNDELCKPQQYDCTEQVQKDIYKYGLSKNCIECLPTCTEIEYLSQVTLLNLQEDKVKDLLQQNKETYAADNVSIVHIYFSMDSVYPKLRKELTSTTQLLSNAGGLLGLCLGFSVISVLEIFYYGTLRLCCGFYRERSLRRSDKKNLVQPIRNREENVNDGQGWFSKIYNGATIDVANTEREPWGNQISAVEERDNKYDNYSTFSDRYLTDPQDIPRGSIQDQIIRAFLAGSKQCGYSN